VPRESLGLGLGFTPRKRRAEKATVVDLVVVLARWLRRESGDRRDGRVGEKAEGVVAADIAGWEATDYGMAFRVRPQSIKSVQSNLSHLLF
jgi:hypothetical protein